MIIKLIFPNLDQDKAICMNNTILKDLEISIKKSGFIKKQHQKQMSKNYTFTAQYGFHSSELVQNLKQMFKESNVQDIYFTKRTYELTLQSRVTEAQLFGCGFKKIYNRSTITPYLKFEKIILVGNISEEDIKQINEVEYLFPQIYLLTLQTTNPSQTHLLKSSPIRKSLRVIKQINLNFYTFLDNAHFVQKMEKSFLFKSKEEQLLEYSYQRPSFIDRLSSYRSFLLSYPKIYEYELHYLKSEAQSYNKLVNDLATQLKQSLNIMEKHEKQCKSFQRTSSPKIKCLILNREVLCDLISPLIYGYFYGPLCEEFINRQHLMEGGEKLTSQGKMYNYLFEKDFDESADYIQKLTNDKKVLEGPYQTSYFHKAKHVIVTFEDPSPIELSLHISCWKQTKHYGLDRIKPAILQQDIANRVDEFNRKLSNGDCVRKIQEWILESDQSEKSTLTEDEFVKLAILAQLTGDLWFFRKNSLKKMLNNELIKSKYRNFLARRQQMPTHHLTQKPQPEQTEDRSQLYRHEPKILSICEKWLKSVLGVQNKEKNMRIPSTFQFDKICINNDISKNRDSKIVILVDGILGYNQLALLRRMIKSITQKQVAILAESFCNSQQYADYLMRPVKDNTSKNRNTEKI